MMAPGLVWDVFCRVVDNFGDIGVCWRLAADLASRGQQVRLWTSDSSALAWMAPQGCAGVTVHSWDAMPEQPLSADVVVEAFGCQLPEPVLRRMAVRRNPPVWINLEYLSAEPHAPRNHGLPSPQWHGPAAGLTKWFFYPGFSAATGGLIREAGLEQRQSRFDATAWLAARGAQRRGGERIVSLFCYEGSAVAGLIDRLADQPTLVLATPGPAAQQVRDVLGASMLRGKLRAMALPPLTQFDYDHLLWSSDINFVRGEDSWVRAQWAGRAFVWQPYRQSDTAHHAKLEAFLRSYLVAAPAELNRDLRALWQSWNQSVEGEPRWPDPGLWQAHAQQWRRSLFAQADLGTQLLGFALEKR